MKKLIRSVSALLCILLMAGMIGCKKENENPKTSSPSSGASSGGDTSSADDTPHNNTPSDDSTNSSIQNSNTESVSDVNTAVKPAAKTMTAAQGKGYFLVYPEVNHPGVAEMDASYEMICTDKSGNAVTPEKLTYSTDNSSVKVNGNKITVPWSVRSSGRPLTVTAKGNGTVKTGSYTFNFRQYTANPTFVEDFDVFDENIWEPANKEASVNAAGETVPADRIGYVKDGKLVFHVKDEADAKKGRYEIITKDFNQAYGSFSARIDMPKQGNANAAFWMMTTNGRRYLKNPAMPSVSNGEIDIVEYFPTWGERLSAALHWYAWHPDYLASSGDDKIPALNIKKGYHIYSNVWTEDAIYWYYDGELVRTYTGPGTSAESAGMNLLLQLAPETKDGWGGKYDPKQYPYTMYTDWVRVYAFK